MTDLAADIAATSRVIDGFDRTCVLVGHSCGGAVITDAGTHRHVAQLLYLAAVQLAEGESIGTPCPLRSADFDRCDAPFSMVCPNVSRGAAASRRTGLRRRPSGEPDLERAMAARATTRYEWPGGHSPMTRPGTAGQPRFLTSATDALDWVEQSHEG